MSGKRFKTHREFHRILADVDAADEGQWQSVPDHAATISQLILADNLDSASRTGSRTRLIRWQPGTLLPLPVEHEYTEEVLVLDGDLVVGCDEAGAGGEVFEKYSYACRPPGVPHGPFTTRAGCLMLEIDCYD